MQIFLCVKNFRGRIFRAWFWKILFYHKSGVFQQNTAWLAGAVTQNDAFFGVGGVGIKAGQIERAGVHPGSVKRFGVQQHGMAGADSVQIRGAAIFGRLPGVVVPAVTDDPLPSWGLLSPLREAMQTFLQTVCLTIHGAELV